VYAMTESRQMATSPQRFGDQYLPGSHPAAPMAGMTLGSRYTLECRIGAGGFSEVWRAHDAVLDRPVAIKLLHPEHDPYGETQARFRNEAQHAGRLSHEHIARVYDFCDAIGAEPAYLIMELIDGPSLADVLASGPLDPARTMDVIEQVAAGLDTAHASGLIHRDIKPGNIMLTRNGVVKITDFGLSHTLASAPVTRTGMVVGTPAYLAPERAAGARATPSSDLYALGVVGYECLAGSPPFTGSPLEVATAQVRQPFPPLPDDVPDPVAALIADLTAKDPAVRPDARTTARRAADVHDWLAEYGAGVPPWPAATARPGGAALPGSAGDHPTLVAMHTPVDPWAAPPQPARRRRTGLIVAGVAAAALAVMIGVAVAAPGSGPARPSRTHHSSSRSTQTVGDFVVHPGTFIGEPVQLAARQLRSDGLRVKLDWLYGQGQFGQNQQPGQVINVVPGGARPLGSLVTIVAAFPGGGHCHHHDFGFCNGNGNGFGNGGGGGNGGNGGGNGES
jgi:eukaryotic-like serine/threonine-protein kinase